MRATWTQLGRAPFTALLDAAILAIALLNGSAQGNLVPFAAQAWGFDPLQIDVARWPTLVTGVFLVSNPAMLVAILLFLVVSVGVYEARNGTRRAVGLFGLSHLMTLLATTAFFVYPMHWVGEPHGSDWVPAGDVGASFGAFGCLGGWIRQRHGPARAGWIGLVTLGLAAKLVIYNKGFGDAGHLIAFFAGMLLDKLLNGSRS